MTEPYEVVVVDDGSRDGTSAVVESRRYLVGQDPQARARTPVREPRCARGMLSARGAYRLFADADGATPIHELKRLEPLLVTGADVAIGSRVLRDPGVSVAARRHRVLAGRVFNWFVARLGLEGVSDSQCGFKAFTGLAAERLFQALSTRGFAFDVELLLLARAAGYRIVEVPVNWADQSGSKVGVLRHGPGMLREILQTRLRMRKDRTREAVDVRQADQEIEPFLAVEVAERAQELERSGIDVVHLEFGEPDFEAPPSSATPSSARSGRSHPLRPQPRDPASPGSDRGALRRNVRGDDLARIRSW